MQLLWLFAVVVAIATTTQGQQSGNLPSKVQSQITGAQQIVPAQQTGFSGSEGCADREPAFYCNKVKSDGKCIIRNYANRCKATCGKCGGCQDAEHWQFCDKVLFKGKCDRWGFSKKCAKTCRVCGCKDKASRKVCNRVKNTGRCKNWQAAKNCRMSCDRCLSDCQDKKSARFCSDVNSSGKCGKWNFAEKCRKTCGICGLPSPVPGNETTLVRHHCEISGDPHLWGFNEGRGPVPFPCVYRVASLMADTSANSQYASVEVLIEAASSMNTYQGQFFVSYVRVTVSLYAARRAGKPVPDKTAVFTTDDNLMDRFLKNESSSAWNITGDFGAEMQSAVEVGSDHVEHNAFLYLWDASPHITFRPVNRAEGFPQSRNPGLFIEVDNDVIRTDTAQFPHTLCSNTNDTKQLTDHLKGTYFHQKNHLLLHAVLSHDSPQFNHQCTTAITTYKSCINLKDAVPKCQPLLEKFGLDCLAQVHTNPFSGFLLCLQFMCGGAQSTSAGTTLGNLRGSMSATCQKGLSHIPHAPIPIS